MPTIYRLETKDGRGPYFQGKLSRRLSEHCCDDSFRQPLPEADQKLAQRWKSIEFMQKSNYLFGFANFDQLTTWLGRRGVAIDLDLDEFSVMVYEVPEEKCILGNTQAVFIKQDPPTQRMKVAEAFDKGTNRL